MAWDLLACGSRECRTESAGRGIRLARITLLVFTAALLAPRAMAFPLGGDQTVLPAGTEFSEEALARPRELFHSEAVGGHKSYLVNLGDLAFNSPAILGGKARQAEMSCGTCHVNGASNPKLFVPGASSRPGTFDTTSLVFNPKTFNSILDPVRIPSLRGARFLAPYGHDGRITSLRDFVYNVIVNEFSGPKPSDEVLDGLVAYINDIDFLPNPKVAPGGRLTAQAGDAGRRGEKLFFKPFPRQAELSCAGCHIPSGTFNDQARHDVGSGGLVKTPTLLNANFNAPYFHDGRYDSYEQVVDHFDRVFDLGLSAQDTQDLVAYLNAVGDGERPFDKDGVVIRMKEVLELSSVLQVAIPAGNTAVVSLAVTGVGAELRELTEHIPDIRNASVGGNDERLAARAILKDLVLTLRRIDIDVSAGRIDDAMAEYRSFALLVNFDVPVGLKKAEPWSLFNSNVHQSYYAALGRLLPAAGQQPQ
ncbi:cytochrome c peroxidase [Bradyrhizobium japonicum]